MNLAEFLGNLNNEINEQEKGTFRCPNCGGKVLKQTKYCVKCKKKVSCPDEQSEKVKKASEETTQD